MNLHPALIAVMLLAPQQAVHAGSAMQNAPAPMLASRAGNGIDIASYLVSEKLDGVRARWDGRALWTRSGHRIDAPASFTHGWPAQSMDGELWLGRGRFQDISDLVRALQRDDRAWQAVRFMAFDLPGDNSHFAKRTVRLQALVATAGSAHLEHIPQRHITDHALLDARLDAVITSGGEGLKLHHALAHYRAGRSDSLLKFKRGLDAEARVVGYRPGKGKYEGMVGALLVEDAHGRRFALGSGLRDADRAKPPAIGAKVTFRYDGLTAKGTPRFARYLRVRHD